MNKKQLILSFFIVCCVASQSFSQEKSVLFLGNSYTYSNDGVPTVLKQVASSMGKEVVTESNSPGGYTFQNHSTNATSLGFISSRQWDYVVLQEQSQMPSFPPSQVASGVYPYAKILCDSIRNNSSCTKTLFFMTWGKKNGDASNCAFYPPICTYLGMQWRLRQSYVEMAEDNDAWAVPVGMVFKSVIESNPEIELYSSDESHPSVWGTYLAACTFYVSIFHETCVGAYKSAGISDDEALILQNAAWNVVTDSLDIWRIDTTNLRVDFESLYLTKSVNGYFANLSENADSCLWEFGDGQSQMQYPVSPNNFSILTHGYPYAGMFDVCLTAYKECSYEKVCKSCDIIISDIEINSVNVYTIFPNPVKDKKLYMENAPETNCIVLNSQGKTVIKTKIKDNSIDISDLSAGIYILKVGGKSLQFVVE